jgi:hypothetical protein
MVLMVMVQPQQFVGVERTGGFADRAQENSSIISSRLKISCRWTSPDAPDSSAALPATIIAILHTLTAPVTFTVFTVVAVDQKRAHKPAPAHSALSGC